MGVGRAGVSAVIAFSNRHRQRAGKRFAAPYLEHATVKKMYKLKVSLHRN